MPNVRSEYSEHYFRDYQSVIPKSTYSIAWSYYNLLHSHWLAIWCIFRRIPLSEENYPNRNPAWKQALLIIDFQGNTRKGSSTSLRGGIVKKDALEMDGIEPAVINHMLVKFLTWCRREDTENNGLWNYTLFQTCVRNIPNNTYAIS